MTSYYVHASMLPRIYINSSSKVRLSLLNKRNIKQQFMGEYGFSRDNHVFISWFDELIKVEESPTGIKITDVKKPLVKDLATIAFHNLLAPPNLSYSK